MIHCKELNQSFDSKAEMLKALYASKDDVLAVKKAAIKHSDGVSIIIKDSAKKSESNTLKIGDTIRTVINTTNVLDSHSDVHINGIWTKSVQEQQGKIYHAIDHSVRVGNLVGFPKDVSVSVIDTTWKELGYDYEGTTQALVFDTKITDKTNADIFKAYRDNEPLQHSISMMYDDIKLAINDPEAKAEYSLFHSVLPDIVNKEQALEDGFFFVVSRAKIHKEGSTVLFGSNSLTPSLGIITQSKEPSQDTPKIEPIDFVGMCKAVKFT